MPTAVRRRSSSWIGSSNWWQCPFQTWTVQRPSTSTWFVVDHDHVVNDELRFVQVTPPGSACSIAFGTGIVGYISRLGSGIAVGGGRRQSGPPGVARARCRGRRGPGVSLGLLCFLQRSRRQPLVGAAAPCSGLRLRESPALKTQLDINQIPGWTVRRPASRQLAL